MLIIPAIDLRGGKCVRLAQGDYSREKVYDEDPVRVAKSFEAQGAEWLHVVDLDGARSGVPQSLAIMEQLVRQTNLKIEFGGGVRSMEIARSLLSLGVARVVVGTKLVGDPVLGERLFGELKDAVIAGIDARWGRVATEGWTEGSEIDAVEMAKGVERRGARRLILTDIARDGMMTGPNLDLLVTVERNVSIPVIQSGGIAGLEDIERLSALGPLAPEGVIVGRAIYEGRLDLGQALASAAP